MTFGLKYPRTFAYMQETDTKRRSPGGHDWRRCGHNHRRHPV